MTASTLTTITVSLTVEAEDARQAEKVLDSLLVNAEDDERLVSYSVKDETYNGWTNYSTGAVNLWLSNDEGLYREALEIAADVKRGQIDGAPHPHFGRGVLAESYKAWVRDELAPDLGASFAADLLGYSLDLVDWYEIADSWLEDVSAEVES